MCRRCADRSANDPKDSERVCCRMYCCIAQGFVGKGRPLVSSAVGDESEDTDTSPRVQPCSSRPIKVCEELDEATSVGAPDEAFRFRPSQDRNEQATREEERNAPSHISNRSEPSEGSARDIEPRLAWTRERGGEERGCFACEKLYLQSIARWQFYI